MLEKEVQFITHQKAARTNQEAAQYYLRWLRERVDRPLPLFWNLYAAHRCGDVKKLAKSLGIKRLFISAAILDCCQPLDRRIFGAMKE
jgi:hypothetical protein